MDKLSFSVAVIVKESPLCALGFFRILILLQNLIECIFASL